MIVDIREIYGFRILERSSCATVTIKSVRPPSDSIVQEISQKNTIWGEHIWNGHTSQLDKRLLSKDPRSVLALAVTAHGKPYRVPLHSSVSKKKIPFPLWTTLYIHDPFQSPNPLQSRNHLQILIAAPQEHGHDIP
jgi:hypothetical protein